MIKDFKAFVMRGNVVDLLVNFDLYTSGKSFLLATYARFEQQAVEH